MGPQKHHVIGADTYNRTTGAVSVPNVISDVVITATGDKAPVPVTGVTLNKTSLALYSMGYTLPKTREAITFADAASIGSFAADAVKAMQMAGVMNGKNGNMFDPTRTATRAEVSAVLRRYVELVIDSATAQGLDTMERRMR